MHFSFFFFSFFLFLSARIQSEYGLSEEQVAGMLYYKSSSSSAHCALLQ